MHEGNDASRGTLEPIIKQHKAHAESLKHEESTEPYNEDAARAAFGEKFIDTLKKKQGDFTGDWWQLALLVKNLEEDERRPDIKPEDRLKQWNAWRFDARKKKPPERENIHLEHANLFRAHLEHANLFRAHLEHAHLESAHLEHAVLAWAHLEHAALLRAHLEHAHIPWAHLEHANLFAAHFDHADLESAHLEHAVLFEAHLEHTDLRGAQLEHAHLFEAHLERADLRGAQLEHAVLFRAQLEHADLRGAHLGHADLRGAHLEHADLLQAHLEQADVRGATDLLFNDNRVEGLHIEGNAPDPWSVLRRQYTGPWFFVHLSLLGIFFAPYVGRALYLTAKSHLQQWSLDEYQALGERVPEIGGLREYHAALEKRFFETHEKRRAVWVLLGLDRGIMPVLLALVVILYNALRGFLTLRVSSLRDAEERASTTPKLAEYYGRCHPLNEDLSHGYQVPRAWWRAHGQGRWLAPPRWLRLPGWFKKRSSAVAKWAEKERPGSLIDHFGLYRLHRVARILLMSAVSAVVYNTGVWIMETWVWVPAAS